MPVAARSTEPLHSRPGRASQVDGDGHANGHSSQIRFINVDNHPDFVQPPNLGDQIALIHEAARTDLQVVHSATDTGSNGAPCDPAFCFSGLHLCAAEPGFRCADLARGNNRRPLPVQRLEPEFPPLDFLFGFRYFGWVAACLAASRLRVSSSCRAVSSCDFAFTTLESIAASSESGPPRRRDSSSACASSTRA